MMSRFEFEVLLACMAFAWGVWGFTLLALQHTNETEEGA